MGAERPDGEDAHEGDGDGLRGVLQLVPRDLLPPVVRDDGRRSREDASSTLPADVARRYSLCCALKAPTARQDATRPAADAPPGDAENEPAERLHSRDWERPCGSPSASRSISM